MDIKRELNYSDIFLKPKKTIVKSRNECDTSVTLGPLKFKHPAIAANMKSVVDKATCKFLCENDLFYIMHRFDMDNEEFVKEMHDLGNYASISVGVNEPYFSQLKEMKRNNNIPEYICIDIAHCWSPKGERMIKFIKDLLPESFLIAGNVANGEAVVELEEWGADCVKLFVGPGKVCTTKLETGFTRGTVTCLMECAEVAKKPLIADGGVREIGDIAKACALGADMVMLGSMFAGYEQSAGAVIEIEDNKFKEYFGSASQYSKSHNSHVEGKKILIKYKGDMEYFIAKMQDGLKSSISYGGGKTIDALRQCEIFYMT